MKTKMLARAFRGRLALMALAFVGFLMLTGCAAADSDDDVGHETEAEEAAEAAEAATEAGEATIGENGLINPNLEGEDEIAALPGMTDEAAAAILEGRPFLDMGALDAALPASLDDEAREALYGAMWIPTNLNTASDAEILLIPGVGDKMLHEFKEYRPYDGMARFEREIGKYVDEEVIEGYEKYVFVPIDLNTASDEAILAIPGVGDRMLDEFKEYRPYENIEQFNREIGKYVDDGELARLGRYVTVGGS